MLPSAAIRRLTAGIIEVFWRLGWRAGVSNTVYQAESNTSATLVTYLRVLLRRFPYWDEGHLRLGELSLQSGDTLSAYASAHCALALSSEGSVRRARSLYLMSRCYVRQGAHDQAIQLLRSIAADLPPELRPAAREEEAAALMAKGEHESAHEILSGISPQGLSAEGKAALEFLSSKVASVE